MQQYSVQVWKKPCERIYEWKIVAEHIEWKVAVVIIISVKKSLLLLAVDGNVGGIKIQNQDFRRLLETVKKQLTEQIFNPPGIPGNFAVPVFEGSSKKPYFVSGLIFFLAAALSKCSRNQVRTAGAKLRGTHRQPSAFAALHQEKI